MQEYEALLETSKSKLVVVDFTAKWCGPCRMIAPILEKLAEENPEVEFVKVDVDEASDVSTTCGIECMPTFHFYKGGEKVDELIGADEDELEKMVAKLK